MTILTLILLAAPPALIGCQSSSARSAAAQPIPTTAPADGLERPVYLPDIEAVVVPPLGWSPDEIKESSRHAHQVWVSPSGKTAYGVIHFSLPFPVVRSSATMMPRSMNTRSLPSPVLI